MEPLAIAAAGGWATLIVMTLMYFRMKRVAEGSVEILLQIASQGGEIKDGTYIFKADTDEEEAEED